MPEEVLKDDSAGLPLRSSRLLANGRTGRSSVGVDPNLFRLGRLDGIFALPRTEFCALAKVFASVVAVADRARTMGGGVGREPPGVARRLGRMEASNDCEVWWTLDVVEIVEMVDTLECVGDLRSWP